MDGMGDMRVAVSAMPSKAAAGAGFRAAAPRRTPATIPDYLGLVRRRWRLVAGTALATTAVAAAVTLTMTPLYRAEAVVMLDVRGIELGQANAVASTPASDAALVRDGMEVLESRTLAAAVARKLDLVHRPEFGGGGSPSALRRYLAAILPKSAPEAKGPQEALEQTIDTVLKRLDVENDGRSHVVRIDFTAQSPQLAADIANAYAALYLEHQVAVKDAEARRATDWLQRQLADLRDQITATERRIASYRQEHNITATQGSTVTAQQLADINAQLIVARSDRLQKEAAIRQVKAMLGSAGADAAAQVLASPLIQRLREQEADVLRHQADLSAIYLPEHPAMIKAQAELDDLRKKIADEVDRIVRGMASEASAARAREEALKANLVDLERSTGRQEDAEIQLHELERVAAANRALYENLLTRLKQTAAQQDMRRPDAQIIATAEPPTRPASPRTRRLIATSAGVSLLLGIFIAFLIEQLDASFRRSEEVEDLAGIRVLGLLPGARRAGQGDELGAGGTPTPLSEALRVIRSSLRQAQQATPFRVVAVTSAVEDEGKTHFAVSLGRTVARSRARCLLIDCHFHRPGVDRALSPVSAKASRALAHPPARYPQIEIDKSSGLHYIAAPRFDPRQLHRSQDLFESAEMRDYIAHMRGHYELIILDAPPTPAVSDVVALSRLADATIFLVRWGSTPRQVVLDALRLLAVRGVGVAGVVLSRVDLRRYAAYGHSAHLDSIGTAARWRHALGLLERLRPGRAWHR